MANKPAQKPPRPSVSGSSPSERHRRIAEGSAPSLTGGTYFLGRYRVVDEIGVGGMASVHLARADGPGGFQKWVAIKRIHKHLAEDDTFIRMFLDEARIAARITHPNVAQVFDLGKHADTYWIAMEYLHGEPLREVMRVIDDEQAPPMNYHLAAKICAEAAEGLHAAHELRDNDGKLLNLVHRDVTPHNLFLTYEGGIKVVDFGIAKVTGRLASTRAGTLKGKLAYMSPEQVRGEAVDRRTDIFALGVVLWELTTGRRLFRMDSDLETLERVQACVVPPPSSVANDFPMELEAVVMRALAKDKDQRYQTVRELSRALQQFLMRASAFVGPEEVGNYMKSVLGDRYQKREAHLQWAAEVTQTISLDQAEGLVSPADEVSFLTYASDVKAVPQNRGNTATVSPARATAPMPARPPPPAAAPPRPAAGRPPEVDPRTKSLPSYDFDKSNATQVGDDLLEPVPEAAVPQNPKRTTLGLGPPPPPPAPVSRPLPSYGMNAPVPVPAPAPSPARPQMHDYSAEEDDAVTHVMASPLEEEEDEPKTQSFSLVHEPPKAAQVAEAPAAPVVVSPQPAPAPAPEPAPAAAVAMPPSVAYPPPQQRDSRSMLIGVIAATTTLAALALLALVVLKVAEKPAPQQPAVQVVTQKPEQPESIVPPAKKTAAAATAAPTATATAPAAPVDPASLPTAKPDEPKPTAAAKTSKPTTTRKPSGGGGPISVTKPPATSGGKPGYLTVVCDPYCDSVSAGGRGLGPSPVVRASLPPGNHGVVLRRKGAKTKSLSVTIVSGQTTARRVKMGS